MEDFEKHHQKDSEQTRPAMEYFRAQPDTQAVEVRQGFSWGRWEWWEQCQAAPPDDMECER